MASRARNDSGGRLDRLREGGRAAARRSGSFLGGLALVAISLLMLLALVSYQPSDPSPNTAAAGPVGNWLGMPGAWTADLLLSLFGLPVALLLPLPFARG